AQRGGERLLLRLEQLVQWTFLGERGGGLLGPAAAIGLGGAVEQHRRTVGDQLGFGVAGNLSHAKSSLLRALTRNSGTSTALPLSFTGGNDSVSHPAAAARSAVAAPTRISPGPARLHSR